MEAQKQVDQEDSWDRWLLKERVGHVERDAHTVARADAVARELERIPAESRQTILDVGCGDGLDSVRYARYGRVTATDLAPRTIADATDRYRESGVTFIAGDFLTVDLPDAPYDVVVSLETLSHVYDQQQFVARCSDVLAPGGRLILTTQNRRLYDLLPFPQPSGYLRRWLDREELVRLLEPLFRVESVSTLWSAAPGSLERQPNGPPLPLLTRLAYSYRLNQALSLVVPAHVLDRVRMRAGLGMTLVAVAVKPS